VKGVDIEMIITITLVISILGFAINTGISITDGDTLSAISSFLLAVLNLVALYTHVA
jgi:hypothetical protein